MYECCRRVVQGNIEWQCPSAASFDALYGSEFVSQKVDELRKNDEISLPSTIGQELKVNPFMRSNLPDITKSLPKEYCLVTKNNEPWENFASLRMFKDNF